MYRFALSLGYAYVAIKALQYVTSEPHSQVPGWWDRAALHMARAYRQAGFIV